MFSDSETDTDADKREKVDSDSTPKGKKGNKKSMERDSTKGSSTQLIDEGSDFDDPNPSPNSPPMRSTLVEKNNSPVPQV